MTHTSRGFAYAQKGQGVQNRSLLLKIVIDFTAFKYDYWFVLTGETFMRNQTLLICEMPSDVSLSAATKM